MRDPRSAASGGEETIIAACDAAASNLPCFRLRDNPDQCPATGLAMVIERGDSPAPAGEVLGLRCALP